MRKLIVDHGRKLSIALATAAVTYLAEQIARASVDRPRKHAKR
jgi:hypothetical protein